MDGDRTEPHWNPISVRFSILLLISYLFLAEWERNSAGCPACCGGVTKIRNAESNDLDWYRTGLPLGPAPITPSNHLMPLAF
ncbi:MAG: hypothetical protein JWP89_61 [Schlesneria sp.]|nr:hypothetical protein [Schlesneria sp.]